jgi:hypothetical protein
VARRRWLRALTASVVLVLAPMASGTGPAGAAVDDGTEVVGGHVRNGSPEAVVVVGQSGEMASWDSEPRGGPRWTCGYHGFPEQDEYGNYDTADTNYDVRVDPVEGERYVFACFDEAGQRVEISIRVFDPGDPFGGVAAVERAMEQARRQLALPLPEPRLNPPTEQLVGLSTWLWVDGPWQEGSATAAIGAVSATVTARPLRVDWDLGDGATVTCDAGVRYDPSRPPGEQESSCTHVFTTSTQRLPGGQRTVTATVVYAVEWSASTGAGGELGELSRSASIPVRVREAQALIR